MQDDLRVEEIINEESIDLFEEQPSIEPIPEAESYQESSTIQNASSSMIRNLRHKPSSPMTLLAQHKHEQREQNDSFLKREYRMNKGYTEWIDFFGEETPFTVHSISN